MTEFVKNCLSGSVDGKPIEITGYASSSAILIHAAVTSTALGTWDEIWMDAYNGSTNVLTLYYELGGSTYTQSVGLASRSGKVPILLGKILRNLSLTAYASSSGIQLDGFANSLTHTT